MSAVIALGTTLTAAPMLVSDAQAERIYDAGNRQWVERPTRRLSQRKPHKKFNRRSVILKTSLKTGSIIIHTDKKFLYYVEGNGKATRYGVGVGKEGFGWNGEVSIKRKTEWPTWTPPAEMRARERKEGRILPASMKGGIENPLGARALYLYKGNRDTMYRIHGTNQPWSIGLNLSSGCIRMLNKDVEHLYSKTKIGTKVVVIGPGQKTNKYFTEITNPLAALFSGG
ncbi:MAG: hypothetical protein COC17_05020 [Hyphomicrobiales bacterium]|nr:L,D-transpeptidase [Hyphomicrobiales bacterium]PCH50074.1 MAG: hypothetical protein COC17_06670 [Hyphomicrobiales bacterium]PCH50500.1 MAG: hypothetical protein COC17_05020 [Hyphomicrobiales bacterium]